jgi:hypothetical protein
MDITALTDNNNEVKQSLSWEASSHTASQEIQHILWNLKRHYWVHKGPPLFPVHTLPPYFPKIDSNITFLPTPMSS